GGAEFNHVAAGVVLRHVGTPHSVHVERDASVTWADAEPLQRYGYFIVTPRTHFHVFGIIQAEKWVAAELKRWLGRARGQIQPADAGDAVQTHVQVFPVVGERQLVRLTADEYIRPDIGRDRVNQSYGIPVHSGGAGHAGVDQLGIRVVNHVVDLERDRPNVRLRLRHDDARVPVRQQGRQSGAKQRGKTGRHQDDSFHSTPP